MRSRTATTTVVASEEYGSLTDGIDGFVGTLILRCEMSIIRPMRITTDFGRGWRNTLEAGEVGLLRWGFKARILTCSGTGSRRRERNAVPGQT